MKVWPMGKSAKNERIRLEANFYNNIAVAAAVGGVLLPFVNLYQRTSLVEIFWEKASIIGIGEFVMPIILAFIACYGARGIADALIQGIKD